jgi:hypothetical protein
MLIIDELTQTAVARFELWQSIDPKTSGVMLFRAGAMGDQPRSLLPPDAEIIQIIEGVSEFEIMTKYYAHMDWGEYRSIWPDLAAIPYFHRDAIEVLNALPKKIKPLSEVKIHADGHSEPPILSPIPLIKIQDCAVFSVAIMVFGDFGEHSESPLNEPELMVAAATLIISTQPDLLNQVGSTALICPIHIVEQMLWTSVGKGR